MNNTETFRYGNITVTVHHSELTGAKATLRDRQIRYAMADYMKDYLSRKKSHG